MLPRLPLAVFRLHYRIDNRPSLPAFAGSAWRGAFGHALKKTVCVVRDTPCERCLLYRGCVYSSVFETPPPPGSAKMRKYDAVQHPFVLAMLPETGDKHYALGLTLFGRAHQYLPAIIHALGMAGSGGVGNLRQPFWLESVQQAGGEAFCDWQSIFTPGQPLQTFPTETPVIPQVPPAFAVQTLSPLRLRREDQYVSAERFQFADLFGALLRRISMLTYFHTDTPLETNFTQLNQAARDIRLIEPRLRWHDWTRYSSRQKTEMKMGGLTGHFQLDGSAMAEFWPYLWLGQWTHAGKAATMGLGRYRIVSASLPHETNPAETTILQAP